MARILIAGEDEACLAALAGELTGHGHEVLTAGNGHDAYTFTLHDAPDVVILDTGLRVLNGYEVCALIRNDPEISPTLPVIFLTTQDTDIKALQKAGATDTLAKRHEAWEVGELLSRLGIDRAAP